MRGLGQSEFTRQVLPPKSIWGNMWISRSFGQVSNSPPSMCNSNISCTRAHYSAGVPAFLCVGNFSPPYFYDQQKICSRVFAPGVCAGFKLVFVREFSREYGGGGIGAGLRGRRIALPSSEPHTLRRGATNYEV